MPSLSTILLLAAAAGAYTQTAAGAAPSPGPLLRDEPFRVAQPSEVIATLIASCERCSWEVAGREAAVLVLFVDDRYSQHLFLVRGEEPAEYRVFLGALLPGEHRLTIALDSKATSPGAGRVSFRHIGFADTPHGSADHDALALAPILHARPNTIGRFTDVPLLMWYETEPTAGGTRIRYSVIFTNEDGGTPADRLMATWGRVTDIEFVYGVEIDKDGRIVEESFQGPNHKVQRFAGKRQGRHPLMWVVTDNNMVSDRGETTQRYAPAPFPFDLADASREAVMDANPWTYRVSTQEARREGRVAEGAKPGTEKIPDPRSFAYLEACAQTKDATLAFGVGIAGPDGEIRWHESDAGLPSFRIARSPYNFPNGCFRGAVALPRGVTADRIKAVRFRAFTRLAGKDEPPLPGGASMARLRRVNKLFLLEKDDTPGQNLFKWTGEGALTPDGPALELTVR